jgi:hypothetical protein
MNQQAVRNADGTVINLLTTANDDNYYDLVGGYFNDAISLMQFYGDDYISKDAMNHAIDELAKEIVLALSMLTDYDAKRLNKVMPDFVTLTWYSVEINPIMTAIENWIEQLAHERMIDHLLSGSAE